ncbi:MAG: hypothetical protein ACI4WX_10170 [Aristaeellaceae bacterium]
MRTHFLQGLSDRNPARTDENWEEKQAEYKKRATVVDGIPDSVARMRMAKSTQGTG